MEPKLGIYPTADGYKLVWKVAKFSTNPFGLYIVSIDAHTGEIVARKDYVNFQQSPDAAHDGGYLSEVSDDYGRVEEPGQDQRRR